MTKSTRVQNQTFIKNETIKGATLFGKMRKSDIRKFRNYTEPQLFQIERYLFITVRM